MDYTENETQVLNDDALLSIFEQLCLEDVLKAEQVCQRWKNVVKTHLAMQKTFDMISVPKNEALSLMRRCGPSLKRLAISGKIGVDQDNNLVTEIAEAFPNLESIDIDYLRLEDDDLNVLSRKCNRLKRIKLSDCHLNDEGLGLLLANLPGLRSLTILASFVTLGDCFTKLGPYLEHLKIGFEIKVTGEGYSHILSRSRNLKTFSSSQLFDCKNDVFSSFCQRNIFVAVPIETLKHVSNCSMLEELRLHCLKNVPSNTLTEISQGCPNLKHLEFAWQYEIGDRGLTPFASCKQLTTVAVYRNFEISDESLLKLADVGILKKLVVFSCHRVSDVGCSAVLARCPQLEELNASESRLVGNATVDAAFEEVESRDNGIALRLILIGTSADQSKGDIDHPLLKVITQPGPEDIINWPSIRPARAK